MRRIIFIATLILMMGHVSMAEEIKNYNLHISKDNQEAANLHVSCTFSLDFQDKDSVSMNLGGGQEFSIDNLRIDNKMYEYEYNQKSKKIVFHKKQKQTVRISMDYDYTNLSAFFIYGKGDTELWETSFGEYFYPYVPNTFMDVALNVETPDSLALISFGQKLSSVQQMVDFDTLYVTIATPTYTSSHIRHRPSHLPYFGTLPMSMLQDITEQLSNQMHVSSQNVKDVGCPLIAGLFHHIQSKVLEDSVIPVLAGRDRSCLDNRFTA